MNQVQDEHVEIMENTLYDPGMDTMPDLESGKEFCKDV